MSLEIFTRRELKYLITVEQYERLLEYMMPYMRPDMFGDDGKYTVSSLYFDSDDHTIYFETKNKLDFRQKLRLRVYDDVTAEGNSFFEIKQKQSGVVNKRRMSLPLNEAYQYFVSQNVDDLNGFDTSNPQAFREIDRFIKLYHLRPELMISYDRHALQGIDDPELRVTFDLDLRCRADDLFLEHGSRGENFIDPNLVVTEVKVNNSVPLWLTRILQYLECEQRSASKYCTSLELLKSSELPSGMERELANAGGN